MDIASLKKTRTAIKSRLTRLKNQFEKHNSDKSFAREIQCLLKNCNDEFYKVQSEIESLEELDDSSYDAFETSYLELMSQINRLLSSTDINQTISNPNIDNKSFNVNLPKISVPTFDGTYENWLPFKDIYTSLIHNNVQLSNVDKFYYLKLALINGAARVIESIPVADQYYSIAWSNIIDRYENKRYITKKHIRALINLNTASKLNLREFIEKLQTNYNALKALQLPVEAWDAILVELIVSKLDIKLNEEWETSSAEIELPTFQQILKFLNQKCKIIEAVNEGKAEIHLIKNHKHSNNKNKSHVSLNSETTKLLKCVMCSSDHLLFQCIKFKNLPTNDKFEFVKSNNLCVNCLRADHKTNQCKSSNCKTCQKKHNTLLHFNKPQPDKAQNEVEKEKIVDKQPSISMVANTITEVILPTAVILIKDKFDNVHPCRILMDSGSQSNYITESFARKLKLPCKSINIPITGIGKQSSNIKSTMNAVIKSRVNDYESNCNFYIIKSITGNLPSVTWSFNLFNIPEDVPLADPEFNVSRSIDMLLGAELFYDLLLSEQIKQANKPIIQNTKFGWVVSGQTECRQKTKSICNVSVDELITKFWKVEEFTDDNSTFSVNEKRVEKHFSDTYQRTDAGRFIVTLPTKRNINELGNTREMALKRFYALERRLSGNEALQIHYSQFMKEYRELKHMRLVEEKKDSQNNISTVSYLPHHAVTKLDSLTTKVRVVFDASAKSKTGLSLNDILAVGPTIQDDLFSIIVRFRTHNYVLSADITKMYRQILVDETQTPLQRILWRDNPNESIQTYELLTVTYGTSPAPYLATKCLQQLANIESNNFPLGAPIVLRDFYVDNLLTGASTIKDAEIIQDQVIKLLALGGFELRQWASNDKLLLNNIPNKKEPNVIINFDDDTNIKTLGIQWEPNRDIFIFKTKDIVNKDPTKRVILSQLSSLFDPLGLVTPIIIQGKILMQTIWKANIDWDEVVPETIANDWHNYCKNIKQLNSLIIPRQVTGKNPIHIELHGFADASERAYGACIYLRTIDKYKNVSCHLLCSRSRVAPLKRLSIPRLELCGALLLARLMNKITKIANIKFNNIMYWTDSTIVLAWIRSESRNFKTFVGNRISEIQDLSNIRNWKHVASTNNPADLVSRGMDSLTLQNCSKWWHGPAWLQSISIDSQTSFQPILNDILPELKVTVHVSTIINEFPFNRFSKFKRLIRVTAFCLRFAKNTKIKSKANRIVGCLTTNELEVATSTLVKTVQHTAFHNEISDLKQNKSVKPNSKLLRLNPFMDKDILRVGGRLQNSTCPYEQKFPAILPIDHIFTKLLIKYTHELNLHAGPQLTISLLREKYWVINARNLVRKLIYTCIYCFKVRPKLHEYQMGNLPAHRVVSARAFENCGVDYCGPILIKEGTLRNNKIVKAYIAIFVCLATKAVHIELVGNLSSESFLAALNRMMSRRGKIQHIYTDNGTNFVGANNELKELYRIFQSQTTNSKLIDNTSLEGITWHFIPPNSPHFGGIWEAGVKAIKYHLKRVVGNAKLTYEALYTVLVQIEAVLNSRPITPLSNDPSDLSALTPAHLLIGDTISTTAEPDLLHIKTNRLSIWQHIKQLHQHFWTRWYKEYISTLQERRKWKNHYPNNIKKGDMVLIKEDHMPPLQWALGRIEDLHPGEDNIVRVATINTRKGQIKRSTKKLCVLPLEE